MRPDPRPAHRWLTFDDSWDSGCVERLLDETEAAPAETIYDPFVGSGTTAVVAKQRGHSTYSSDASPLAILVTRTKLFPPTVGQLGQLQELVARLGVSNVLGWLLSGVWPAAHAPMKATAQFTFFAALLRIGWQPRQQRLDPARVQTEWSRVCGEMLADIGVMRDVRARHRAVVATLQQPQATSVRQFARRGSVMVTSPPFLDSNANPAKVFLSALIAGSTDFWKPATPMGVEDYRRLLRLVAEIVEGAGCRAAAIETSWSRNEIDLFRPHQFLADQLRGLGFRVRHLQKPCEAPEPTVVVIGQR